MGSCPSFRKPMPYHTYHPGWATFVLSYCCSSRSNNFCEGCLVRHSGSPCLTTPTTRDGQPSSCLLLHISCSLSSFNIKMGCRQEERQGQGCPSRVVGVVPM